MATEFSFVVNRPLTDNEKKYIKQMIGSAVLRSVGWYEEGIIRCESSGNTELAQEYEQLKQQASDLTYAIGASGENIEDKEKW